MYWATIGKGFLSGFISGMVLLSGLVLFVLRWSQQLKAREAPRDLSHYGRKVGRSRRHHFWKR